MTEFTKDCLRFCVRVGNDRPETFNIATANNPDANIASLAAFALAQMERAENAEAERDRLKGELGEAEEAIRQADNRTADPGDLSREGYSIDFCKRVGVWLNSPAVVRARERGK